MEVHVRADVEYVGVEVPIDFDERYLRLSRVENRLIGGVNTINDRDDLPGGGPEEGNVVVASAIRIGNRRIAAAGEEFQAATLHLLRRPAGRP